MELTAAPPQVLQTPHTTSKYRLVLLLQHRWSPAISSRAPSNSTYWDADSALQEYICLDGQSILVEPHQVPSCISNQSDRQAKCLATCPWSGLVAYWR